MNQGDTFHVISCLLPGFASHDLQNILKQNEPTGIAVLK